MAVNNWVDLGVTGRVDVDELTVGGVTIPGVGSGSVTTVSVATANGFAGTVATADSTPAITVKTSVTGLVKGNGTALSAATVGTDYSVGTHALATGLVFSTTTTGALSIAVAGTDYSAGTQALATGIVKSTTATGALSIATAGTDYSAGTQALATGIVKSTTTTGALSIAAAGDFPTLNQSTTGQARGILTGGVPVAANSTGVAGTVAWENGFLYVCVATDTWLRVAIATWP